MSCNDFLIEFKALLEKYGVSIGFTVSELSDTYNLYDEKLVVETTETDEVWLEVDGWWMDSTDIKIVRRGDNK